MNYGYRGSEDVAQNALPDDPPESSEIVLRRELDVLSVSVTSVNDDAMYADAMGIRAKIRSLIARAESHFEAKKRPHLDALHAEQAKEKEVVIPAQNLLKACDKEILAYETRRAEAKRAELERQKKEDEQRLLEHQKKMAEMPWEEPEPLPAPVQQRAIVTELPPVAGGYSKNKPWQWEIEDIDKFKDACVADPKLHCYLQENAKTIKAAVSQRGDTLKIPGLRIWRDRSVVTSL